MARLLRFSRPTQTAPRPPRWAGFLFSLALMLSARPAAGGEPAWRWSNPQPHGNNIYDLAWRNGEYWQVGDRGRIYVSTNRVTWTVVPSGTTRALRGIAFAGEQVVICGEAGTILRGTLSTGFQAATLSPPTTDWLEGVAASPGTLVAVGDNAAVYRSTDGGATWQRVTGLPFDNWLRSVAWSGNTFVAVGEGGLIATSPTGQSWTRRSSGVTTALNRVVGRDGVFYAVGDNGRFLWSINQGANWTRESLGITNNLYTYAQAETLTGVPRLVAGESALLLKSTVLGGWTDQLGNNVLLPAPTWDYYAAVWDGARFLVGGRTGLMVESLETNVTIAGQTFPATLWFEESDSPRDWLWEVLALPERYIAVGDRAQVLTSDNGADWWSETVPDSLTNTVFLGLGGSSQLVVAVGSAGSLMYSRAATTNLVLTNTVVEFADCAWVTNTRVSTNVVNLLGLRWTALEPRPTTNSLQGVAHHAGRWVAVGDAGTVLTGADDLAWQRATLPGQPPLSGVAGSDAGWVVTGRGGVIFSSPDALAWTPRASGTTNWIFRVRWLGDRFVAVGQNGTLLTSPDGSAWTPRATGTTAWLNDVLFLAGRYFVCGTQGTLLTSTNASDWTALEGITGKSLYGLAGRGFQLVSVGVEGIILRAPLEPLPPAQILGYDHRECPDARVDRFRLGGTVDQRVALEVSGDLQTWQRVGTFEFDNGRLEPELIRTNPPSARAEFFRLIPAAP